MPIQVRCIHCARLLSIGRHKAGCVLPCPVCGGMVPVPTPTPETPTEAPGPIDQPPPARGSNILSTPDLLPLDSLPPATAEAAPPRHRLHLPVVLGVGLSLATVAGVLVLLLLPQDGAVPVAPTPDDSTGAELAPPGPPNDDLRTGPPSPLPPVPPVRAANEPAPGDGEPVAAVASARRRASEVRLEYAGFKNARALAVDVAGRVFVSDSGVIYRKVGDARPAAWMHDPAGTVALALDGLGRLLAGHTRTAQVVVIDLSSREETRLAGKSDGGGFQAPRRLAADRHGGVYLCDGVAVYHVTPAGHVNRREVGLSRPRSLALAPDGKTLYAIGAGSTDVMAYPVGAAGALDRGRVLCRVEGAAAGGLIDLTVDAVGDLFVLNDTDRAVERFGPDGRKRGTLRLPDTAVACAVGGPGQRTLYVLTRTALYTIDPEPPDPARPGKP